tara:strand:- start:151 stop:414 length:264 start_codon:yes stop_codon:yes gene_type:complete
MYLIHIVVTDAPVATVRAAAPAEVQAAEVTAVTAEDVVVSVITRAEVVVVVVAAEVLLSTLRTPRTSPDYNLSLKTYRRSTLSPFKW